MAVLLFLAGFVALALGFALRSVGLLVSAGICLVLAQATDKSRLQIANALPEFLLQFYARLWGITPTKKDP